MRKLLFLGLLSLVVMQGFAQLSTELQTIIDTYDQVKEPSIIDKRFKHAEIEPLILQLKANKRFTVKELGKSIEGRSIYHVQLGTGPIKVLLWSQMHGDEPTATMALMDIFRLFAEDKRHEAWKEKLLSDISIHAIPMLNPDGTERYQRRNALGVDLNRDALRLQNPESQLLKQLRDELDADFGFNLHDQSRYYTAGNSAKPATLSFLAPAYDYAKSVNPIRKKSMKLIGWMTQVLADSIPGQIAKYDDSFEPRAFGDNIQKWGTSTILIESGGYANDRDKQYIRKMNFIAMMASFEGIANGKYAKVSPKVYHNIPYNDRRLYDLLVRNVTLWQDGKSYKVDLAIDQAEVGYQNARKYYLSSRVVDLGDLSTFFAYDELDAEGLEVVPGKLSERVYTLSEIVNLGRQEVESLLSQGISHLAVSSKPAQNFTPLPFTLKVVEEESNDFSPQVRLYSRANFFLAKDGVRKYAVINGFLHKLNSPISPKIHGLVE